MLTAIIPARGGSKGVKRKNLRTINGESLIAIALKKCLAVADRVIVSTEDREIFNAVGGEYTAIWRPVELAQDSTSAVDVVRHAVELCNVQGEVLYVQCTAPLAKVSDFQRCVDERGDADMSVLCHPWHGFVLNERGQCLNANITPVPQRQEMPPQYLIAGSAWAFDASYVSKPFYSGKVRPVEVAGYRCDIDSEDDLRLANLLAEPLYQWMQS